MCIVVWNEMIELPYDTRNEELGFHGYIEPYLPFICISPRYEGLSSE
jgi:hypothetical protein